jgi:UDP:flavonoid glycosyltransferase YjiC (YdhE family)
MDKPSVNLSKRINEFLDHNQGKPIVFITTGTIDKTPIHDFIEFFVNRNYAVMTTCDHEINDTYKKEVFYNKLMPLNYICGISNLVIHQCGSGMYHYPIMNRVPFLTLGTQCYDREDIALRLQELGVSGHIPHPDDNSDYWNIFLEMIHRFEKNELVNFTIMDKLRNEINQTMSNFNMKKVIDYALA